MSSNILFEVLSKFDINIKYFKIKIKNQLNRKYEHFYWVLCFVSLPLLLINTFNLVLISDDDVNRLNKFGSIGYKMGGKTSSFMMDACAVTFYVNVLVLIFNYLFDKMQWLLKMSSIYEEIRTKHFDKFLMNFAKKLSFYYKFGSVLAIISVDLLNISILYFKWDQVIDYPIGSIIASLTLQFGAKVGFPFIFRQIVIIILICRMHCFLFKSCNKSLTQISGKHSKIIFKNCLSFHYKLCESVEELQTFLRPMFVLITTIWCPIFCYILYFILKNSEFERHFMMILTFFIGLIFLLLILILSTLIALIDIEAKKGSHTVFGFALKQSNKQDKFHVRLFKFLIGLKLFLNLT